MPRRIIRILLCVGVFGAAAVVLATLLRSEDAPVHSATFYSRSYDIDQIYRSMMGPKGQEQVLVSEEAEPELLWITGFDAEIVDEATDEPVSPEFMCHANLGFGQMPRHRELFQLDRDGRRRGRIRLFTLSQGQMDVKFPPGFGVPVASNELLTIDTQILNLNPVEQASTVKHKTTIDYVRDRDLSKPMKPLFQKAAQGLVLVEGKDAYYDVAKGDPAKHGPGCDVGVRAGGKFITDNFGRKFAAHWEVEPGIEENRTLVTQWMDIPFDTTVHYIAVHLHPFAASLELRDLTTNSSVYKSLATPPPSGIGLAHVESFSSEEGIPIYKDHEYELVSVYDNTTSETQDSMAIMFLYMLDEQYISPQL
jgi:hypothetical protein